MDKLLTVVCLLVIILVFVGCCMGLAVSNPSEEEFIQWANASNGLNADSGSYGVAEANVARNGCNENMLNNGTHSFNYWFFTIYTANIEGEREIYLGAVKQFFSLNNLFQNDSETMVGLVEDAHMGLQS